MHALCKKLTEKLLWWWQNLEVTENCDLLVSQIEWLAHLDDVAVTLGPPSHFVDWILGAFEHCISNTLLCTSIQSQWIWSTLQVFCCLGRLCFQGIVTMSSLPALLQGQCSSNEL